MPLLASSQHDLVRPLFGPLDHHLAVTAPAAVYVDDPAQPAAAFTWTGYRFFLRPAALQ